LKKLITHIRRNGKTLTLSDRQIRELVYANMIWFITFAGFLLYVISVLVFKVNNSAAFIQASLLSITAFIAYYFIVKAKLITAGKYWLALSVNFIIIVFDQFMNLQGFNYLYLFAFMATAINIFSFSRKKVTVVCFTLLPLIYMIVSRSLAINLPIGNAILTSNQLHRLEIINLVISTSLYILFLGYMILNNISKHQRLVTQSIGLQATLDNSEASIWSIDNDYTLTVANSKYYKSIEEAFTTDPLKSGTNLKEHPLWQQIPATFKRQYKTVLEGKELLEEIELDGRFYEIKAVPIYDRSGRIQGATFGSRDITVSKKAAEMLLKAKRAAEEADDAKARFISNMSHEIRTPLNGIIGTSRILLDEDYLPLQLTHFNTLKNLSEHTVQIVNNILDFAKIEAGKGELETKRFNMLHFSEKIKSIFTGTAQLKGLKYNIEINGNADVFVKGDEVRLSQVLINLLGNAFKFTESGSVTLKINIKQHEEKRHYMVGFAVADTGIGIKSEHTGKIFESFTQADANTTRKFGGTGLGLSIASKIVTLMGGTLQVKSEPGVLTIFSFNIRLHMSSAGNIQWPAPKANQTIALKPLHILLAEDNKINQLVASKILQKWQHKVVIANNGKEALNFIREKTFDVVLMDLDMPIMDGYEATEIIKQQLPHPPVIALTAASFDDMENYLTKKGFVNVVQKPFAPEDLQAKIAAALANHADATT
jgi:signal transduction histidine kinase/CheY-like chemotaxis protein